jgi:hypothetical protein
VLCNVHLRTSSAFLGMTALTPKTYGVVKKKKKKKLRCPACSLVMIDCACLLVGGKKKNTSAAAPGISTRPIPARD